MPEFHLFLEELVSRYPGSKADLARAVGISPSSLSKLFQPDQKPRIEVCLKLAEATGTPPSRVLRAAGRGAVADMIEELYGPAAERFAAKHEKLSPKEVQFLAKWRRLTTRDRQAMTLLMQRLLSVGAALEDEDVKRSA